MLPLQPPIRVAKRQDTLHIEENRIRHPELSDSCSSQRGELVVVHSQDDGAITGTGLRELRKRLDSILAEDFSPIDPGIIYIHLDSITPQDSQNVDDASIPDIRAVLLEGETEYQDLSPGHGKSATYHEANGALGHLEPHVLVDPTTGENDVWVVPHPLRFVSEIVRVDSDAMPSHETRFEVKKIPLAPGRFQNAVRVDVQLVKDQRQLVDQRDVQIPLYVFGNL
jgi:hypothetical protein